MNSYLSRAEKETLVRLLVLNSHLHFSAEEYSKVKAVDKQFLGNLRRAKSFLQKAIEKRLDYLDKVAEQNLMESMEKIEIVFLPKVDAKKAYRELAKLQMVFPMEITDFENWYEFVIESTCKICKRKDYEECPARRVLMKYDVYPNDPGAVGKCQYGYENMPIGTVGEAMLKALKGA